MISTINKFSLAGDVRLHSTHAEFTYNACRPLTKTNTAQTLKFSSKDFFSKCDQIRRKLRIWSHLLKKFLMENFIFYAVHKKKIKETGGLRYIYQN